MDAAATTKDIATHLREQVKDMENVFAQTTVDSELNVNDALRSKMAKVAHLKVRLLPSACENTQHPVGLTHWPVGYILWPVGYLHGPVDHQH